MLIFLNHPATPQQILDAAREIPGYIKFVVDVKQKIMTIGGGRHFEGEQLLLSEHGSVQSNLWGGGVELAGGEIDYESMINIRPRDGNPKRDVVAIETRTQIEIIVRTLLPSLWK